MQLINGDIYVRIRTQRTSSSSFVVVVVVITAVDTRRFCLIEIMKCLNSLNSGKITIVWCRCECVMVAADAAAVAVKHTCVQMSDYLVKFIV